MAIALALVLIGYWIDGIDGALKMSGFCVAIGVAILLVSLLY